MQWSYPSQRKSKDFHKLKVKISIISRPSLQEMLILLENDIGQKFRVS